MSTLSKLLAREVFDSRGRPTIEVEAVASNGASGRSAAPSGMTKARFEVCGLRDEHELRLGGWGVRQAVEHVRARIAAPLIGMDLEDQAAIDQALLTIDGTPDRSRLGANTLLAVSMACASASAEANHEPLYAHVNRLWNAGGEEVEPLLPMPMVSMISANRHRDHPIDFQTFLMVPLRARSFAEAMEMVADLYRCLAEVILDYGESHPLISDDGGYAPILRTDGHAIEQILESGVRCGLKMGEDVGVALDVAAGRYYDPPSGLYHLPGSRESLDSSGMIELIEHWNRQYPIVSVEDPLAEDDWDGWSKLTERLGSNLQIVGDDLFASQPGRLQDGIARGAANALLVKPDQLGTLSETLDVMRLAHRNGYRVILSARSGETEDTGLADLAVGTACGQIKVGSVARSERLAKYNRLLRVEEALGGPSAPFANRAVLGFRTPGASPASS